MLIVNFFSLNFTSIEIEGERVSSSQNEGTLVVVGGGGGGGGGVENKQGQTKGEGRIKTRES